MYVLKKECLYLCNLILILAKENLCLSLISKEGFIEKTLHQIYRIQNYSPLFWGAKNEIYKLDLSKYSFWGAKGEIYTPANE